MKPMILFQEPGVTIAFDPVAHTMAPYWSQERTNSTNHGFADLRDRPELADSIPEVQANPALRNLIVALNRKGSRFMSIGCDRGPPFKKESDDFPVSIASYTTVAFRDLQANRSKNDLMALAYSIWEKFKPRSSIRPVLLELSIEPLKYLWDLNDAFALDLRMLALGRDEADAIANFEWLAPEIATVIDSLGQGERNCCGEQ